jgi:hypothetical protein
MGAYYVGLDVHSRETMFVIQDATGTVVGRGAVPTTPEGLARVCRDYQLPPGTAVGLETGTSAFYVARAAAALHLTPTVVDTHEVRRKAHRPAQKSDRRDAFEVCDVAVRPAPLAGQRCLSGRARLRRARPRTLRRRGPHRPRQRHCLRESHRPALRCRVLG